MGRKIKSFSTFALVALCAGALVAVLIGASPAPGAPPPPPGCGTGTGEGGGVATGAVARPAVVCPTPPTTPPAGGTTSPTTSTTTSTGTSTTTTAPTSTSTGSPVTTPVIGTVQSTTPTNGTRTTSKVPTTPVNVIKPPAASSTATPPPPVSSATPRLSSPAFIASIVPHHARVRRGHHRRTRTRTRPARHHHKAIVPPPPPKITPPHIRPKLPAAVKVTNSVATPSHVRFKATDALAAVLLAGFLVLLLAFPAELFNKTYDENEEEIHILLTRMGLRRRHLSKFAGWIAFVVVGAGLSIWLGLAEGSDGNPLAVAVGLLVAVPVVMFAFEFPAELYLRTRSKIPGSLRVLPTALLVGAACAVLSRAIHLVPAYLYGVFAGYTAAREDALAEEEEGKSVLVGVIALAVLAGACWFAWGALDPQAHGASRDWFVILVSTAFFWIFVLAAESLVFGLIPLKYLDGSRLRGWRNSAWLIPQLLAAAFFIYVQMLHGSTQKVHTFGDVIKPFLLFVGVGLLSFAFWGYFQWKGRPTAGHHEETPEAAGEGAPDPVPAGAPAVPQPALLTAADAVPRQPAEPPLQPPH
jgi:hypothetical protein